MWPHDVLASPPRRVYDWQHAEDTTLARVVHLGNNVTAWFDRKGRPISREEWWRLIGIKPGRNPYSLVARSYRIAGCTVETLWIGWNQSHAHDPPLIFQTTCTGRAPWDGRQQQYASEGEALAGHHELVRRILAAAS